MNYATDWQYYGKNDRVAKTVTALMRKGLAGERRAQSAVRRLIFMSNPEFSSRHIYFAFKTKKLNMVNFVAKHLEKGVMASHVRPADGMETLRIHQCIRAKLVDQHNYSLNRASALLCLIPNRIYKSFLHKLSISPNERPEVILAKLLTPETR